MFGDFVYQYAPGVFKVQSVEECKEALKAILVENKRPEREDLLLFCLALEQSTFKGLATMGYEEAAELTYRESNKNYASFIAKKIKKYFGDNAQKSAKTGTPENSEENL